MLYLKNIRRDNGIIKADYYPEGTSECGSLVIAINSGVVLEKKTTSYDEPFEGYLAHAAMALKQCLEEDELPEKRLVMWY